ncbi:MAG: ABC transporter substrate-binding protein, partial [Geminicoccaceae bacterium]
LALGLGVSAPAQADGTLLWGDNPPAAMDPHAIYDVPMQFILLNVYDGLYRYVGNPPELEPWLAESHTVSDDGLTWEFKLREGATFHDGSEITANDVVYSFQRLLAMGKAPSGAFQPILKPENVTAVDKYTVRFVLDKPYAPFLAAVPIVAVVNPRVIKPHEQNGDWGAKWLASNEAGSGAYVFDPTNYRPQEAIDLERYEDFFMGWDQNPDPIDVVKQRDVKETSTRVLALIKGEVDSTDSYLPTDQVERIEQADGVHVAQDESMRLFVVRMNNSRPPFDNINTRKCFAHAFNYEGFIQDILKGYAVRNPGPLPNNLWGYPKDLVGYDYDMDKAKEYCDKARAEGADLDRKIELRIQSQLEQTTQAAQLFQSDLLKLGINLQVVSDLWPNLTASTVKPETTPDMWIHWVSTYFVDPENWIGQMYDSQFQGTWKASAWYQNDKVDQLLREARASTEQSKRAELYEEATRLVVEDCPDIWVYNTVQLRGLSDRVKGYTFSPVGSGSEVRYMSVEG